ncbi:MAG TPA: permease prefix domain 1-containing protein, partial [Longimicrobiales bacterium]|nr:permease prefix domain 1-containing protein [Longimicrobiales bacterium]
MGLFDLPGVRRLFRIGRVRSDAVRELDEELAFHRERTVGALTASGMAPEEAREEARRRFGDARRYRRRLAAIDRGRKRMERRAAIVGSVGQGLEFAFRGLRRSPGFATAVVLTLT